MNPLLWNLLQQTSRSFYLTLRVLPRAIRPQIGLAYLLARTTDTIADTKLVPLEQRLQALQKLRERILGNNELPLNFGELARQQALPAERALLENAESALGELQKLSDADLQLVRKVLDTITSGQELDLKRFASGRAGSPLPAEPVAGDIRRARSDAPYQDNVVALQTEAELDDYTYRVAGCVGEFWTKMCRAHLFPAAKLDDARLLADSVRFGKGLQLVNILRDLPADLQQGRCYLPADKLAGEGLKPGDLLRPESEVKFRPFYDRYLDLAESHLAAGWTYTNLIPRGQMRVRLACAWPILIGVKTIGCLRTANVLDAGQRVKISRAEVRGIIARSTLLYPFPAAWKNLFSPSTPRKGKDVA